MDHGTNVLIKVRKIVRSLNLESKRIQKEFGVSIPQVLCLGYLKESENYHCTQLELRKYLNLNSSTVSGIISRLEKRGFIARLPNTKDKRVNLIALTSSGDKLFNQIPPLLHDRLSNKLEKMDEGEINLLDKALDTLTDLLEIQSIDASPLLTAEGDLLDTE